MSEQIGELLSLRTGVEVSVHVREDDDRLVVDCAIFQTGDWIPFVLTMSPAEAHCVALLINTAADHSGDIIEDDDAC